MIKCDYTLTAIPRATSNVGNAGNNIMLLKLGQELNIYGTCPRRDAGWAPPPYVNVNAANEDFNMKLTKSIVATAFIVLLSVTCLAQEKSTGAIKGRVRVEKGSPGGVAVIVHQAEREITRVSTDRKGEFVVAHLAAGFYSLTFRKSGLAVGSIENLEVKTGQTRTLGDRLFLAIDEGSIAFIRGSVFTDEGRSVPGVKVELARIVGENSTQKLDSRITGETGEFVFRVSPDTAKYRVTLKTDGGQSMSKDVEVESAAVYHVALTLKPNPK